MRKFATLHIYVPYGNTLDEAVCDQHKPTSTCVNSSVQSLVDANTPPRSSHLPYSSRAFRPIENNYPGHPCNMRCRQQPPALRSSYTFRINFAQSVHPTCTQAKLAVQIVINYEEGAESCVLHEGDTHTEVRASMYVLEEKSCHHTVRRLSNIKFMALLGVTARPRATEHVCRGHVFRQDWSREKPLLLVVGICHCRGCTPVVEPPTSLPSNPQ